ncbi:hypothetical protein [Psychrobacter sp. I-STPA10]|uniref:hypothetical protein n=1 Tax=Psychrobacter sp. I-STPA10 TaxID=2585769 RepID=UPI001E41823E|nr:hypothetical protein [Psychrobacter sp. I-STPA10]
MTHEHRNKQLQHLKQSCTATIAKDDEPMSDWARAFIDCCKQIEIKERERKMNANERNVNGKNGNS